MSQRPIYDHHSDEWWTPRDDTGDHAGAGYAIPGVLLLILLILAVILPHG